MNLRDKFYKKKLDKAREKLRLFKKARRSKGVICAPEEYAKELLQTGNNDKWEGKIAEIEQDINYYENKLNGRQRFNC